MPVITKNNKQLKKELITPEQYGYLITAYNTATTTELANITSLVNIVEKYSGKGIFNSTVNKPVWAVGANPADRWVFADGTTAHSPV